MIYRDSHQVIEEARLALVIKDVATSFMYAYPSALKDEMECKSALQHFVSSKDKVGVFLQRQRQRAHQERSVSRMEA